MNAENALLITKGFLSGSNIKKEIKEIDRKILIESMNGKRIANYEICSYSRVNQDINMLSKNIMNHYKELGFSVDSEITIHKEFDGGKYIDLRIKW